MSVAGAIENVAFHGNFGNVNIIEENPFSEIICDAIKKYEKHLPKKGESWKTCDLFFLREKIEEEYHEFMDENIFSDKCYDELLDMILVALMMAQRIRGK